MGVLVLDFRFVVGDGYVAGGFIFFFIGIFSLVFRKGFSDVVGIGYICGW